MVPGDQFSLDFRIPAGSDRFFFALRPDADAARAALRLAGQICRRQGLSARPCDPERLHVSLITVESARGPRKGDIETALRIAENIEFKAFSVDFDRICTFHCGDRNAVVLRCRKGVADVSALRRQLRHDLSGAGFWRGPKHIRPHLTLLWTKRHVPDMRLEQPIGWRVEDFVLVRSLVGRGRHVDLGKWSLCE